MTGKELIAAIQEIYKQRIDTWDPEILVYSDAEWNMPTIKSISYRPVFIQGGHIYEHATAGKQKEPMIYDYRLVIELTS
jgi:hypothetical protein